MLSNKIINCLKSNLPTHVRLCQSERKTFVTEKKMNDNLGCGSFFFYINDMFDYSKLLFP